MFIYMFLFMFLFFSCSFFRSFFRLFFYLFFVHFLSYFSHMHDLCRAAPPEARFLPPTAFRRLLGLWERLYWVNRRCILFPIVDCIYVFFFYTFCFFFTFLFFLLLLLLTNHSITINHIGTLIGH